MSADSQKQPDQLRRGWTTGACATAATVAALEALLGDGFPDPVSITLPGKQTPSFALATEELGKGYAQCGIIKDAGDDPDVTHGAMIIARVQIGAPGSGVTFKAGTGVGTFTKPGLPLPPGEPAINPVPRKMMREHVEVICEKHGISPDVEITVSVPTGEELADKTWNPRLGILGGISILGTTGIVIPYSCAAWIHSIHRGIDVAWAEGLPHVVGSTGDTSEKAAMAHLDLPMEAYLDMGDFVGGLLKYLKKNPVPRLTIAGGFAKLVKLAQGHMDLHSGRSQVDFNWLAAEVRALGGTDDLVAQILEAKTAKHVLEMCQDAGLSIADRVAELANKQAQSKLDINKTKTSVLVVDRIGVIIANS
ncbi:cobalt-precorrin-5B (C(1))-methyltransferase [Maritalea porphyrae]|uniref:cobalt-precorrin-5B (C(1))-methyltransferase n=1 Tax=Maritalea porphyrae TaxID=880732 RepID=UPI0022AEC3CD|nr:cobalt-precorrin-5B (C(1))-methyltransferase [Maritalea porphyrae]MCZ4271764.1 cobalt-precorrin-5B (C(1))-methyltransferase [Maritalea porphyrae]